jgi:hypothetical protein
MLVKKSLGKGANAHIEIANMVKCWENYELADVQTYEQWKSHGE